MGGGAGVQFLGDGTSDGIIEIEAVGASGEIRFKYSASASPTKIIRSQSIFQIYTPPIHPRAFISPHQQVQPCMSHLIPKMLKYMEHSM